MRVGQDVGRDQACKAEQAYVKLMGQKRSTEDDEVGISPTSTKDFTKVQKQYRLLAMIYPVLWAISKLDLLLFFTTGYAVSVLARRPA